MLSERTRNPFALLADLFSSIWLGISLISLILVYSTLGSAVPLVRQYFELTEFQYFNHWVFAALVGLFCVNLIVATVRRIRLNPINAGVWTVHSGLLVLCIGSFLYFGRKIEGDVLLNAPRVHVLARDRMEKDLQNAVIGQIAAAEGKNWRADMPMLGGKYDITVVGVQHEGLVTAASIQLEAKVGDEPPRTIEMSQSNREGRVVGVNDKVVLLLSAADITDEFFDDTTPMLMVSRGEQRAKLALPGLPYYRERFEPEIEPILDTEGQEVPSDRHSPIRLLEYWRMPIPLDEALQATAADWPISLEIDGYLPYAELQNAAVEGGDEVNPMARVRLRASGRGSDDWLFADSPARSMLELADGTSVEFRWLGEASAIDPRWTEPAGGSHVLDVLVKDKDLRKRLEVTKGGTYEIEGTDYKLTIEDLMPSWPLMTAGFEGARTPTALVWVETPQRQFQRSVLQRYPELSQDRDRAGKKILATGGLVDENIEIAYTDGSCDRFVLVAGAKLPPTVIHTAVGGQRTVRELRVGQTMDAENGVSVTLAEFIHKPKLERTPRVIPMPQRAPFSNVRRGNSLVRVHIKSTRENWSRHVWVPHSPYNTEGDQTAPTLVDGAPGVGRLELVYGRVTRRLPGRLVLERLQTDFYPGQERPSGWTSYVRYEDPETRNVYRTRAYLNNTARVGPWTLFQSTAAGDHESWTGLGVGNRDGVMAMLGGCSLVALGMAYAFCVKPALKRRRRRRLAEMADRTDAPPHGGDGDSAPAPRRRAARQVVATLLALWAWSAGGGSDRALGADVPEPAADLLAVQDDPQHGIDAESLGALVVQYNARYSTIEAWARDILDTIHGPKSLFGLDPVVAAVELMFNADAYRGEPIIYVKDRALRKDLVAHPVELSEAERRRIVETGMVSYEFLKSPAVDQTLRRLASDAMRKKPMDRLSAAMAYYQHIEHTLAIVPAPDGKHDTPWHTVDALFANTGRSAEMVGHVATQPVPGVSREDAEKIVGVYLKWRDAWLARDAAAINASIGELAIALPDLSPAGVYPPIEKRRAEVTYHRLNLMRWAWVCYIAAFFISIFAVATRYSWVRALGLLLLLAAVSLHGGGLGLRWYVIGRIPVANMYEAVVSSTWLGAVFGLVLELLSRRRTYLLAAALLGFFALALPELNVIDSNIETMMPILDDIMLRIHTVLIIGSYAVITLAFAVANCYLFVAAFRDRVAAAQAAIGGELGAIFCLVLAKLGWLDDFTAGQTVAGFAANILGGIMIVMGLCATIMRRPKPAAQSALEPADFPVKAGILEEFDRSQRVLLYTSMIALFVGLVLGAVWADYSWGRPWGWDPKEVFALNTWLVYAILIHARFVTRRRALWTSVLSVCGFAVMQFNWWVVNFYIVGLHSYA